MQVAGMNDNFTDDNAVSAKVRQQPDRDFVWLLICSLLIHGAALALIAGVTLPRSMAHMPVETVIWVNTDLSPLVPAAMAPRGKSPSRKPDKQPPAQPQATPVPPSVQTSVLPAAQKTTDLTRSRVETSLPASSPAVASALTAHLQAGLHDTPTKGSGNVALSASATGGGNHGTTSASGAGKAGPLLGSSGAPSFLHRVEPVYPFVARRIGKEAEVTLRLSIDETGKLERVEIVRDAGYGFSKAAIAAVESSSYRPATRNGVAVAGSALITIRFVLQR
jgi:protein TonB